MGDTFREINRQVSATELESTTAIAARLGLPHKTVETALTWGRVRGLIAFDRWDGSPFYYRRTH
jgi:hypothetical protein